MNILVTGGVGYIGSHTVRALAAAEGLTPVVFDNLSTGHAESVPEGVTLVKGGFCDIMTIYKRNWAVMKFLYSSLELDDSRAFVRFHINF